jgi:signal peptidase II
VKGRRRLLLQAGLIAAGVVVLDQISKAIATSEIERGSAVDVVGPLRFTLNHNDGIAFGLAGGGGVLVIGLSMIALAGLGAFVASAPDRRGIWLASGLIFGGAVGNLIDRVRLGHVVDFILLPNWPAFNLADCAITVGVVLLAWCLIRDRAE